MAAVQSKRSSRALRLPVVALCVVLGFASLSALVSSAASLMAIAAVMRAGESGTASVLGAYETGRGTEVDVYWLTSTTVAAMSRAMAPDPVPVRGSRVAVHWLADDPEGSVVIDAAATEIIRRQGLLGLLGVIGTVAATTVAVLSLRAGRQAEGDGR